MSEYALRPINEPADLPFLKALYATTRDRELALMPWTEAQKQAFLAQQFEAQHRAYRDDYTNPGPERMIVEVAGSPVGRLYLQAPEGELRVIEIALLPAARRRGLGTKLLQDVIARAQREGREVNLHVDVMNPARRLYERLGFSQERTQDFRHFMVLKTSTEARADA